MHTRTTLATHIDHVFAVVSLGGRVNALVAECLVCPPNVALNGKHCL